MNDHPTDQPETEPTVLKMLLARIDGYCAVFSQELDLLERVTSRLDPDQARSCALAIEVARLGVTEIRLRAHARPLDEPEP
jgi:hypothetical protein